MDVQQSALLALGALGNPEAEELLLSIAGDAGSESTSRYYAIDALSKIGSEEATDLFQELLGSDDAILRSYAVAALARYDDPAVARTLELALRDSFWRVRVSALEGIAERGAAQALEAVMYKVERDPEMRVRYEAVKTVAAIGTEEAWRFLRELYVDQRTPVTVRNSIAEQLIEGNLDESREAIATVLEQEWDRPGSTLLDYIGKKLSQTRAESLDGLYEKLLAHPNFIIRIYGIRGIGLNGHNEFRDTLQHLAQAEDAHRAIRSNARAALDALGSPVGPSAHDAAGETVSGEGAD